MSKIIIKAKKDAPDFVQIGNLTAEKRDGIYRTDRRELADWLVGQNYGEEASVKEAASKKSSPVKAAKSQPSSQFPQPPMPAPPAPLPPPYAAPMPVINESQPTFETNPPATTAPAFAAENYNKGEQE